MQAEAAGLDLLFCNTYHLLLQPGAQAVDMAGGLHRFMGRRRPIITDSGGFQVRGCAARPACTPPHALLQTVSRSSPLAQLAQIFSLAHGTVFDEVTASLSHSGA